MNGEELAEKYKEDISKDWCDGPQSFDLTDIGEAFLAGYRANKPKTHVILKDPDWYYPSESPKEGATVLLKVKSAKHPRQLCYRLGKYSNGEFQYQHMPDDADDGVMFWYELPPEVEE